MKTLILTDNPQSLELATELKAVHGGIDVRQSPNGKLKNVSELNVRTNIAAISEKYNLIISIHCKQFFPRELITRVRCINVHPGLNPYNRGWFPQVFSIINGMKAGATIHEMDAQLDHGAIIAQREYFIKAWDTSGSAYTNILKIERDLLLEHFRAIQEGSYATWQPAIEGNLNLQHDFEALKKIDLTMHGSFRDFLNYLRALTHGDYRNAYFLDETGRKIYVRVVLEPDNPREDSA
jgi:dTDP-4-amino-4,6-dideoxyglucose formyltransferase